jgi:hypothetical protein
MGAFTELARTARFGRKLLLYYIARQPSTSYTHEKLHVKHYYFDILETKRLWILSPILDTEALFHGIYHQRNMILAVSTSDNI